MRKLTRIFFIGLGIFFLATFPLIGRAADEALVIKTPTLTIPSLTFNLAPVVQVLTAPFRFILFVKEALAHASRELAGFLSGPPAPANPRQPLAQVNPQGTVPERIVTRLIKETTLVHDVVIEHSPSLLPPPLAYALLWLFQ